MSSGKEDFRFPSFTKTVHRTSYPSIDPRNPANSAKGKVVLVTGGGSGIGKYITKAFLDAGATAVAIIGRRENVLAETKAEMEKEGYSGLLTFQADVSDEQSLNSAFAATEKSVGKIDIVVANVGHLTTPGPAATVNVADYLRSFEVNINATFLTFRAFLAHKGTNMPTFISVNSAAAQFPRPNFSSYTAAKMGELQLIASLQVEHQDIRMVSMHPGTIDSDMYTKAGMPGMTFDDPSLPSSFAVWLASPAADFVAGRFLWSHWDVDELISMKEEIVAKRELIPVLSGWPKTYKPVTVW